MQGQVTAAIHWLVLFPPRRKATRSAAEASLDDDRLSSDEEFDSAYGPSSIASLLTEGNLQTSSC